MVPAAAVACAAAAFFALNAACAGGENGDSGDSTPTISGRLLGAALKYPSGYASSSAGGVDYEKSTSGDPVEWRALPIAYAGARVCVDVDDNGFCDSGEDAATSDDDGRFAIRTAQTGPLTAVVGGDASYLDPATGAAVKVSPKLILRAAAEQVQAAGASPVMLSALSTEVLRTMQADKLAYADARKVLADRLSFAGRPALSLSAEQVLGDFSALDDGAIRSALLFEDRALQNRAALAAAMLDRGYVSAMTVDPVRTIQQAQAAAFSPEDIPRYDHLFVVIFENHSNHTIDSRLYPDFYRYLNVEGNKAANYFSTGNPSEPNYVSLASGDDWGIANDAGWNCLAPDDGANRPSDVYNPRGDCTDEATHNIKGRRNLFSALYQAGLGARVYSESMDPGQDPRVDGKGNQAIMGANRSTGKSEPMIPDLYKTKHHPAVNFDEVRNRPDFFRNLNRTVGGGQWDSAIQEYARAKGISWNTHQLEDDLQSGDVGALNFIVPDQCDDIHGTGNQVSDCVYGPRGIKRGNAYARYLVDTIQASPLWQNTARRVGIVLIFDEGSAFFGSSSCCGWNVRGGDTNGAPLDEGIATPYANYESGNRGDGPTIFAVLNNQPAAPKGVVDSDTYSHFSFNRTLQNMFGLADPGVPVSYMNRSKYTESYIAAHLDQLPEYQDSADTHFDSVRPMNHHYVMKRGDRISGGLLPGIGGSGRTGAGLFALGPDPNQINIWALK
jgi:hypothetical protein